uniref:Integrator complex subunit 14 n=1 Tax=Echinococcus granulosus TaxID=6210 RepID=A0A068WV59_ECHGR|nr:hypothetical protein EgrG_000354400 [Echinococcus granulosus]
MPWIIAIDWSFQMLRPLSHDKKSLFVHSQSIAKEFLHKLLKFDPHDFVSLVAKSSSDTFFCPGFTDSNSTLENTVDSYPNPSSRLCLRNDFTSTLIKLVEKELPKFNIYQHLHVLVITDGWSEGIPGDHASELLPSVASKEVTCIVVNLFDAQSSSKLNVLKSYFEDFHVVENASTIPIGVVVDSVLALQRCEVYSQGFIACGHLIAPVTLAPSPCIRKWKHLGTLPEQEIQLFVEVFGFLQVNDVSHPPIASRHTLIHAPGDTSMESRGVEVLRVMMAALGASETVGMANVYIQPRTKSPKVTRISDESVELPGGREFLTHGFISRFSARRDCILLLSLFGSEAVAWLGQFDYLAPVAVFEGKTVYNAAEHVTPFPVCVAEQLSYVVPSSAVPGGSDFHYVNWANTASGPSADFSKVLRLAKRLPEKADIFLKELSRLASVTQALGLPRLLDTLRLLLMEYLPPTLDAELLSKVRRILRIETPSFVTFSYFGNHIKGSAKLSERVQLRFHRQMSPLLLTALLLFPAVLFGKTTPPLDHRIMWWLQ